MKIGIDIIANRRYPQLLKVKNRFLTINELNDFSTLSPLRKKEFLAGRWAIKEALIKCDNRLTYQQIEVRWQECGAIAVNILNAQVSLSHEKDYTVALAIIT